MYNVKIHNLYNKTFINEKNFINRNINHINSNHFVKFNNIIINNFFNFSYEVNMNLKCNRFFFRIFVSIAFEHDAI